MHMFSALGPTQLASTLLDSPQLDLPRLLRCGSFVRPENPLKSFMPEKSVNVTKAALRLQMHRCSAASLMPTRVSCAVPFDLIVQQGPMGPLHCGPPPLPLVRVDELQNILLTYYHTLAELRSPRLQLGIFVSLCICEYLRARIFVSVAVAVLYACSSWWGFVLIKCLFALLFKLVSFHSASASVSVSTVLSLSMSVCFCPDILSCLFCRRIMIITNFRSFLNLRAAVNNFVN